MHKSETFLKSNENKRKDNNIIFLNIDGTILNNYNKSNLHDLKKLQEYLTIKYNDNIYTKINPANIGKVFYEFDNISLGILYELLDRYKANLIITKAFDNSNNLEELKALLRIYDLDKILVDICNVKKNINYNSKKESIKEYITNHNIDNYLILDEHEYTNEFGENFRRTQNKLVINDINYANLIFNQKLKVSENENNIKLFTNDKEVLSFKYDNYNFDNLNILYNKLEYIYCLEYGGKQYIEYLMNYLTKRKNVDYILLNLENLIVNELNISGSLDSNNIYTINKSNNDINHSIQDIKRKILSLNKN